MPIESKAEGLQHLRKARRHNEIRLSRTQQVWIYSISGILFLSGTLWAFAHYILSGESDFGPRVSPLEPWSLRLHGAAAMAFLVLLGSLLPGHMRGAWLAKKNLPSGVAFLSLNGVLIISGYALYYVASEDLRPAASWVHLVAGVVVAPALLWHVLAGRKTNRVRRARHDHEFE